MMRMANCLSKLSEPISNCIPAFAGTAHIRRRWPHVRILLRGDSGFAREELMAWCEDNAVDYLFGLAQNERLVARITTELARAAAKSLRTGKPQRRFADFMWITRNLAQARRGQAALSL